MILLLMMVFEVSLAMVIGFVLGRIWQIRYDFEQQRDRSFALPPAGRITHGGDVTFDLNSAPSDDYQAEILAAASACSRIA